MITVRVHCAADPPTTWSTLADVQAWPEWNPACAQAEPEPTEVAPGTHLRLQLRHPRGRLFWTTPIVTVVEPNRRFVFETRALGLRAPTDITLTPGADGGTDVELIGTSRGPLAFTYRLMFPEKAQALLWSGALTGLARHLT